MQRERGQAARASRQRLTSKGDGSQPASEIGGEGGQGRRQPASQRDKRRGRARATARVPAPHPLHPRPYKDYEDSPPQAGAKPCLCTGGGGRGEWWGPLRSPLLALASYLALRSLLAIACYLALACHLALASHLAQSYRLLRRSRVFVRAGEEEGSGGDPCGRPCSPSPAISPICPSFAGWLPTLLSWPASQGFRGCTGASSPGVLDCR